MIAYHPLRPCFITGGGLSTYPYAGESLNFWYHLSKAGLISDGPFAGYTGQGNFNALNVPQTTNPAGKISTASIIIPTVFSCVAYSSPEFRTGGNGFWLFAPAPDSLGGTGDYPNTVVPLAIAQRIDAKIDDGLPGSGNVGTVETPAQYVPSLFGTTPSWYASCENGPGGWNTYNVSSTTLTCQMAFINQF